jgi:hypothetical protein
MKLFIYIFYSVFGFLSSSLDTGEEVINALKQGKSSELVKFFDEKVSIKLINQEDVLSKAQAEANLKFFFEKHPVKTISSTHISSITNNAQYITATLETTNGKFRVSVLLKRNLISQFRIETDNE